MIGKVKGNGAMQRIAALVLGIAALIYAIYHISSLFGEDITTVASGVSTETTVVDTKGYIFRDEKLLYSENQGVSDYMVGDGSRVSVGDKIANVHSGGSTASKSMLRVLDKQIEILERSTESGLMLADLPEVNQQIDDAYYSLAKLLATGDTGSIAKQTDELLMAMNCHSLITKENSPVKDTLDRMIQKRDSILTGGGESIVERANESGYFYSYADGYEQAFTMSAVEELTSESFYKLTTMKAPAVSENTYGKISDSCEWRFVVSVSEIEQKHFKTGTTYWLRFTENGNTVIPMTLEKVIDNTRSDGKILIFAANRLPDGFVFNRCQTASIEVSSISGIYVPKSAVHRSGGNHNVYILKGSVVCYRRIQIIYEGKDYYLVSANMPNDGGVEYLGTNELIIVKGNNLFEGRILD